MFYLYVAFTLNNEFKEIGITTDLERRFKLLNIHHKSCKIVYYECFDDSINVIKRERKFSNATTDAINELVETNNPTLSNLINI